MFKVLSKSLAAIVGFAFMFPASLTQARTFDLREQTVYAEAFRTFVKDYDLASQKYRALGPTAFVDAISVVQSPNEKKWLTKTLGSLPPLPKVSSDQALLIIDAMELNAGIHTVEVSNIDEGLLIVDGTPIDFDPAKDDLESVAKKIESALDRSTTKISYLEKLSQWILPNAYAGTKKRNLFVWGFLGAIGAIGVKKIWEMWSNRNGDASLDNSPEGLRKLAEERGLEPDYYNKHGAPSK